MPDADPDDRSTFDVLDCRSVHRGFHALDVVRVRQRRLNGSWTGPLDREVYRHDATVAILLHDPGAAKVVLVEQPRLPAHLAGMGDRMVQVVAGFIDKNETAEAAAIRETREETGLQLVTPPRRIMRAMTTPGAVTEVCTLFYGEIDRGETDYGAAAAAGGVAGEEEETRLVVMSQAEMIGAMDRGDIFDGLTTLLGWWLQAQLLSGAIRSS